MLTTDGAPVLVLVLGPDARLPSVQCKAFGSVKVAIATLEARTYSGHTDYG